MIGDVYEGMDVSIGTWPSDETARDADAYLEALDSLRPGDISFYLNAHQIGFHAWSVGSSARPISVHASAVTSWAKS